MPQPLISVVQATANSNSLHAAMALSEVGYLHEILTTLAYNPDAAQAKYTKWLPSKLRQLFQQELSRRTWHILGTGKIYIYPWEELLRVGLVRSNLYHSFKLNPSQLLSWVLHSLDRRAASHHLNGLNAVYGYEDGVATTFTAAKQQGLRCLYDLPIPYYQFSQAIQAEEAERFPELAVAMQAVQEPRWKLERKEQEISLADHIFVASSVTQRSLVEAGVSTEKISVIPYGAPIEYFRPQAKPDAQFRALYVGRMSPRKGVQYLLEAWQSLKLPNAELLFVGSNLMPEAWLQPYQHLYKHIASIPHVSLNQYYSLASVLVFPSLVEGFGLVLTEAMACGIPVITTPNTAGPDIITDGIEGFIVPIRDVEALEEKLEWCYRHPTELAEMGRAARKRAEQLTWQLYRQRLVAKVSSLLST